MPLAETGSSEFEFLGMVNAVVLGVLIIRLPESLIRYGFWKNYRLIMQAIVLILFWELFVIQTEYQAIGIPYSRALLGYDTFVLAVPFVTLSRLIAQRSFRFYQASVLLFAGLFVGLAFRQAYLLTTYEAWSVALAVPVVFNGLGCLFSLLAVYVTRPGFRSKARQKIYMAYIALVLLALYFLVSRLLDASSGGHYRVLMAWLTIVFALALSDFGGLSERTRPLVGLFEFRLASFTYPVPLLWLLIDVLTPPHTVHWWHWCGAVLGLVGLILVLTAKFQLGGQHAWAGLRKADSRLVTRGVYGFMRHPIYVGVALFMTAGVIQTWPLKDGLEPWAIVVSTINLAIVAYLGLYVFWVALRETEFLSRQHGEEWTRYAKRVGPFWPRAGGRLPDEPGPQ